MGVFRFRVPARHNAVVYRNGRQLRTVGSGMHRKRPGDLVVRVDLRDRLLTIATQEIPTAEGVTVKVSAAVQWRVVDAQRYVEQSADPEAALYLATQLALREQLAPLTVDDLASRSRVDSAALSAAVADAARAVGASATVVVRDVILPAQLREAAMAVMTAKQRGLARLEEARAETAALRSLANGAKLLDTSPALARLRLVQSAPYGSQLVLRIGDADD